MERNARPGFMRFLVASIVMILGVLLPAAAHCDRVLIVTTDRTTTTQQLPALGESHEGEYVLTDMVGSGYPFDVATYGRFAGMDLAQYDIIFLNGYSVSTPLATIAEKCHVAMQQGKKIFINGYWPFRRYDTAGNLVETLVYAADLFGATVSAPTTVGRVLVNVPSAIEKDPNFSTIGLYHDTVRYFTLPSPPSYKVTTASGSILGFLTPQGGAMDDSCDYEMGLLDYGKIVTYLRSGGNTPIGFANDRIDGQHIASFEVHCDSSSCLPAITALNQLSADMQVPLRNLIVYRKLSADAIVAWNSVTSPYMLFGSHSRTHPNSWPVVTDITYETTGAITEQRKLIPATGNYLDWSGHMDPTTSQIDQSYAAGLVFSGAGSAVRGVVTTWAGAKYFQRMPTNNTWFVNLSNSTSTPYCLGQTADADNGCLNRGANYTQEVINYYSADLRYGMYTFGFFHDYSFDPVLAYQTGGIPMSEQIRATLDYLKSQGVKFVPVDDLILRLRDYVAGNIVRSANPDGTETVTVTRPDVRVNEIKIGMKGTKAPIASGESVLAQRYVGENLYVTLRPEVTSTVNVVWSLEVPVTPVVTAPAGNITSDTTATWYEPLHASAIAEYQYCVGVNPGSDDTIEWTSAGKNLSVPILMSQLPNGQTYYVSVRARYATGLWSTPGSSSAFFIDCTPPWTPVVSDDGIVQASQSKLHFVWSSRDNESGIPEYQYTIGTQPGASDVIGWTSTTRSEVFVDGLQLTPYDTYYLSVKARNGVGVWSAAGTSNGIRIEPSAGSVKAVESGESVDFRNAVVTRAFSGEYYVESLDRSGAIKIISSDPVEEGQVLHIVGIMQRSATEVYITDPTITVTGTDTVKPILIPCRALAGAAGANVPGAGSGIGLNNVGLLVTIMGKIKDISGNCIFIDDGSGVLDYPGGAVGALVSVTDSTAFREGSTVKVSGICVLDGTDPASLRRAVRIKSDSDVRVLIP